MCMALVVTSTDLSCRARSLPHIHVLRDTRTTPSIVALLYWWMGKAKQQRKDWQMAREAEDDKEPEPYKSDKKKKKEADFSCTSCGGDAYEDDKKCSHCGDSFEDEIEEADEEVDEEKDEKPDKEADFTCTSCGADAWDDDDKCRSWCSEC